MRRHMTVKIWGSGILVFFFKQKTAYEMRISDWSSDVCSSDLHRLGASGASLLAHDRCRPPCPAAAGAHQPGARRLDEPDCLSHDAGRFVLAAPAPSHPRNLAAPAALAAQRQRSVLARFLASIEPNDCERLAPALLPEFPSIGRPAKRR